MSRGSLGTITLSDDAVRLASRLSASLAETQRIILFTGTADTRDVSAIALQSALAFARLVQQPILLVDGVTESPSLHDAVNAPLSPGLTEILDGKAQLDATAVRIDDVGLWFVPRGKDADYTYLLGSETCRAVLQQMRRKYRLTIVNGSSLLQSATMSVLTAQIDGVVAVVAAGRDHKADVVELKRIVDGLKVNLIGAILATGDSGSRQFRSESE